MLKGTGGADSGDGGDAAMNGRAGKAAMATAATRVAVTAAAAAAAVQAKPAVTGATRAAMALTVTGQVSALGAPPCAPTVVCTDARASEAAGVCTLVRSTIFRLFWLSVVTRKAYTRAERARAWLAAVLAAVGVRTLAYEEAGVVACRASLHVESKRARH
eukprot:6210861-Pleurochrysis_carterae.AAC.1